MAKIENSFARNLYGDGYEKILTMDDGRQYIIKNSFARNLYGDGYEQVIIEKDNYHNMAKIENSFARNLYGDGYEKILTMDDGRQYIIKNSFARNLYGDGYEQVIIEKDNYHNHEFTCNLDGETFTRTIDHQFRDIPPSPLPKGRSLWLVFIVFTIFFIIPIFVGVVSICLLITAPTVTQLWWAVIISVIMIIIGAIYVNTGK